MSVHKRRWKTAKGEMKEAWVIDYWHGGKRHHGGTFELRKDADAALAQIKVDKGSGKHVAPSRSITVEKAAQLWLEEAHDLERSTVKVYADVVAYHIVPMIGQAKLANITTAKVKEFQNSLREGGRSQYTIKRATQFLGSIIDEAVERGLHSHNVVRSISRKRKSGSRSARTSHYLKTSRRSSQARPSHGGGLSSSCSRSPVFAYLKSAAFDGRTSTSARPSFMCASGLIGFAKSGLRRPPIVAARSRFCRSY